MRVIRLLFLTSLFLLFTQFTVAKNSAKECVQLITTWPCYKCNFVGYFQNEILVDEYDLWQLRIDDANQLQATASTINISTNSYVGIRQNTNILVNSIANSGVPVIYRDGKVEFWDIQREERLTAWFFRDENDIYHIFDKMTYDARTDTLLGVGYQSGIQRRTFLDGTLVTNYPLNYQHTGAFSPDAQHFLNIVTHDEQDWVEVWDLVKGEKQTEFLIGPQPPRELSEYVPYEIEFSPDGNFFGINSRVDGTFSMYTLDLKLLIPPQPIDPIMNMAFAPNNQLVASGSRESKVYVWRIPDEPVDGLYEPITIISTDETGTPSVFFSADSDIVIITTPDDMLSFWDISSCIEDNEEE